MELWVSGNGAGVGQQQVLVTGEVTKGAPGGTPGEEAGGWAGPGGQQRLPGQGLLQHPTCFTEKQPEMALSRISG